MGESKYTNYIFPSYDFLTTTASVKAVDKEYLNNQIDGIHQTLLSFDIDGKVIKYTCARNVIRYEIKLNTNCRFGRILKISDELKQNLGVKKLAISKLNEEEMTIAIDVVKNQFTMLPLKELVINDRFQTSNIDLTIPLGETLESNFIYTSLLNIKNIFIAGGTGSGKTSFINTTLLSLLLKNTPDDLKLLLIDLKMVELNDFNDLPHLITPVITDLAVATDALNWATLEMNRRHRILINEYKTDIESYNNKMKNENKEKLPYLLIVIDEVADLLFAEKNINRLNLAKLVSLGPAFGIHVIVTSQMYDFDYIANFRDMYTSTITFRTHYFSIENPMTIEPELNGCGDMLFKLGDRCMRLQTPFASCEETLIVCDYIRGMYSPDYLLSHADFKTLDEEKAEANDEYMGEDFELVYSVAEFIVNYQVTSINRIQSQFMLGFRRTLKILSILEKFNVITSLEACGRREILVSLEELKKLFSK